MRKDIIEASKLHFKAHIEKHRINVENLLNKSVGVAEHPDIMDTIEKELEIMAEYEDKLEIIKKYFPLKNSRDKEVING
mgnify:FL=1|jgi:hypothetical protein|tara:strand:+ start:192 stop:428 length:237 start_codon:yes stop_codon:yes gene_type:complete